MRMRILRLCIFVLMNASVLRAQNILVPMDLSQTDHLKAYGVAYWALDHSMSVQWVLNYRGGSFIMPYDDGIARQCRIRGVRSEALSGSTLAQIQASVEENNMEIILLEKAPSVAVYSPPNAQPWDDAVTLALTYSEIPYEKLWDEEVLTGSLDKYDWLHLHHEDFTGQYGKFYSSYRNAPWYIEQQRLFEMEAKRLGFEKVSRLKLAVAKAVKQYVLRGGFLFAMCSATDTYDIALAAEETDICNEVFDGDPIDPEYRDALDFSRCLAFERFSLITQPSVYEHSDIDTTPRDGRQTRPARDDYFTLFEFSAKYDPVPTMLTQNHVSVVHDFMGQTTAFRKGLIKKSVVILAEKTQTDEVKYIHGNLGKGTFTYLGGHDPEDYHHLVGDPVTELSLHKNSPGYRLILNNILFPAAKKKKRKT